MRLFDAQGRLIREEPKAVWALEHLEGTISEAGQFRTAGGDPQAGSVKATVGGLAGSARVRVVPALPWKWDFEDGVVPPHWINATGKFAGREEGGAKVLVKLADNPATKRARVFMGGGHLANYTVEADVLAREERRQMGDAGVVAQRYQLVLFGNAQKLELQSWQPETARTVHQNFAWKPATWYRLKLRVDKDGNSVRARGKAWPASDPEPEAWMLERVDPIPNLHGSPGVYADATVEVSIDNVSVTANGATPAAPAPRPASGAALFEYDRGLALEVREAGVSARDGVEVRDISYANLTGGRTAAYVVAPEGKGQSRPAVLFVHWFAPREKDSNRTQFLRAGLGAGQARRGLAAGRHHVVRPRVVPRARLRGGLPALGRAGTGAPPRARRAARASRRGPGARRVRRARLRGHVRRRPGRRRPARERGPRPAGGDHVVRGLVPAEREADGGGAASASSRSCSRSTRCTTWGGRRRPSTSSSRREDGYVPKENADAFFAAAAEPKEIHWYDAGHGLSEQAVRDRQDWLAASLGLTAPVAAK